MKCVFTIVAKNYIGLALILRKSFRKYNDIPFYIIVADEIESNLEIEDIYVAKDILNIDSDKWNELTMKYDLTEFCTSIKPFCFQYFFEKDIHSVIYFDPDILFFDNVSRIFSLLEEYDMVLTPHISYCHPDYDGDLRENQLLGSGVFNLGFCAISKNENTQQIVEWWGKRLLNMCFSDPLEYLYTDQHWMDLMPCYLGERLFILRDLGYNLAPWNYFERMVNVNSSNKYSVTKRNGGKEVYPLVFVHFSGYDYKSLLIGNYVQKNISKIHNYSDIQKVIDCYKEMLLDNKDIFNQFIDLKYSYNYFHGSNTAITSFNRRLFNGLIKEGVIFSNPFDSNGIYFSTLKKNNMIIRGITSDRLTMNNIENADKKVRLVNRFFRLLYKIVGYNKYILIIKVMRIYSRYEKHIFLLKK